MAATIDVIRKRELLTIKKQIMLQAAMQITLTSTPSIMVRGSCCRFTCI